MHHSIEPNDALRKQTLRPEHKTDRMQLSMTIAIHILVATTMLLQTPQVPREPATSNHRPQAKPALKAPKACGLKQWPVT